MSVTRRTYEVMEEFHGSRSFSTTAEGGTGWAIADTSTAGTPTYASVTPSASGEVALTLAADSEAEIVTLYDKDVLSYDIDNLLLVEMVAKVSGIDSVTTLVFGMSSARNDTADSVAENVWFRMQGSASTSNVVVESDDGTTDNDDKATGVTLSSTYKRFTISFENGKSDIRFYIDGARVAASTTFAMASTGSLQRMIMLQKASGTGTPAVTIDSFRVVLKQIAGA